MRSIVLCVVMCWPVFSEAQKISELFRMGVSDANELTVGAAHEPKKKTYGIVLGADGRVYMQDDGKWNPYETGAEAKDLHYVMSKKGDLYITGRQDNSILIWESSDSGESWEKTGEFSAAKTMEFYTVDCDMKSGDIYLLYATTDGDGDACRASVYVVSSSNTGRKWTDPQLLNQDGASCDQIMAGMTSFKDGKLFSVWSDESSFKVDRSYDGKMWLRNDISINAEYKGNMTYGIPRIIMDNSDSKLQGMIYMSGVSPTDSSTIAWIRKTGNLGDSWTSNLPLDQTYNGSQYFPHITIDPAVGVLYAAWIAESDGKMEAWLGHSLDAGQKFVTRKLASWEKPDLRVGEFNHPISVSAYEKKIIVTWLEVVGEEMTQKVIEFDQKDLFDL